MTKLEKFGNGIWTNEDQLLLADYYFVENGFKKILQIQTIDTDGFAVKTTYEVRVQNPDQDAPNDDGDSRNSIIKMGFANWQHRADIAKNDPSYTKKIFEGEFTSRKADCIKSYNWWLKKVKSLQKDGTLGTHNGYKIEVQEN